MRHRGRRDPCDTAASSCGLQSLTDRMGASRWSSIPATPRNPLEAPHESYGGTSVNIIGGATLCHPTASCGLQSLTYGGDSTFVGMLKAYYVGIHGVSIKDGRKVNGVSTRGVMWGVQGGTLD